MCLLCGLTVIAVCLLVWLMELFQCTAGKRCDCFGLDRCLKLVHDFLSLCSSLCLSFSLYAWCSTFVVLSVCLLFRLGLSIHPYSGCHSIYLSFCLSFCLSAVPSVCCFICLPSVSLSIILFLCVVLSVILSLCLSFCLCICMSFILSVCHSVSVFHSIS